MTATGVLSYFRVASGILSFVVFGLTISAVRVRCAIWADKGSAYMQLLLLTAVLTLTQTVGSMVDVAWLQSRESEVWDFTTECTQDLNMTTWEERGCWIRRFDANINYLSLSLVLVSFLVVTFFFLRLALRLYLSTPDPTQSEEIKNRLYWPLLVSVAWIALLLTFSLSGVQPRAFTCQDPVWAAFIVSMVLVMVILASGVAIIARERSRSTRGSKFWNSLLGLAAIMLVSVMVGLSEGLDNVTREQGNCFPLDATYAALSPSNDLDPTTRGFIHLFGRFFLYTLPSISLLALFRHHYRRRENERGSSEEGNNSSRSVTVTRPGASMSESLLGATP